MEYPKRKTIRLEGYDYSSPGYYFITVCTEDRRNLLCQITQPFVGTVALDGPRVCLTSYGEILERQLEGFRDYYEDVKIDSYVIMPNHFHLLIHITEGENGPSRATVPTSAKVGRFVGTIKRFCNREIGRNIWQARSNDRIIRNEKHYLRVLEYMQTNPLRWLEDELYLSEEVPAD